MMTASMLLVKNIWSWKDDDAQVQAVIRWWTVLIGRWRILSCVDILQEWKIGWTFYSESLLHSEWLLLIIKLLQEQKL